jgi:hypothetical protein
MAQQLARDALLEVEDVAFLDATARHPAKEGMVWMPPQVVMLHSFEETNDRLRGA